MNNKKFIKTEETKVVYTHYMPFDSEHGLGKTEAELLREGYLIEDIPEPEQQEGKVAEAHYTPEKGYWHEYIVAPPQPGNPETEIAALKTQVEATQEALDFILMSQGV